MANAYCCDRCGDYFKSKVIREYVVGYPLGRDGGNSSGSLSRMQCPAYGVHEKS